MDSKDSELEFNRDSPNPDCTAAKTLKAAEISTPQAKAHPCKRISVFDDDLEVQPPDVLDRFPSITEIKPESHRASERVPPQANHLEQVEQSRHSQCAAEARKEVEKSGNQEISSLELLKEAQKQKIELALKWVNIIMAIYFQADIIILFFWTQFTTPAKVVILLACFMDTIAAISILKYYMQEDQ